MNTKKEVLSETEHSAQLEKIKDLSNSKENLKWLCDNGFGLFIHWSLDVQLGCVVSHTLVGASEDYINRFYNLLPKTFNPYLYNADAIADLAVLMGVKYVVFTTKHHNGFCMWDTKTTDFNIMNTPYKKDVLKEYVEAIRSRNLKVGFYYSPEDFLFLKEHHEPIARGDRPAYTEDLLKEYMAYLDKQLEELTTEYGKVDLFFFDGDFADHCIKTIWKYQKDILVTRGAIKTPEQSLWEDSSRDVFEACITMGTAWAYQPTNEEYKSARTCIQYLIEARARGGALLLNAGLDSYGMFPKELDGLMREIGLWTFVNHESIENVMPCPLTHEKDIWFTMSKDKKTIYAFLCGEYDWKRAERREIKIPCLVAKENATAFVLGASGERSEYYKEGTDMKTKIENTEDGLLLSVCPAQRLYCYMEKCWPNQVVVKLQNVEFL